MQKEHLNPRQKTTQLKMPFFCFENSKIANKRKTNRLQEKTTPITDNEKIIFLLHSNDNTTYNEAKSVDIQINKPDNIIID